jgi:hypothetical protein
LSKLTGSRLTMMPRFVTLSSHLLRPTRGGAAGVILVFAILLWIASNAGIVGLPLTLILTSWFFKYAYILFDHAAHGFDEPPVLDIQMMNPIDEQRPIAQVAIAALIIYAIFKLDQTMGITVATLAATFAAIFLPASIAILGVEGSILKAANPAAWLRIATEMGPLYALVLAVIMSYALLGALASYLGLWLILQLALSMFFILSIFSVLGGAVYESRSQLGIEAWNSPERTEKIRQQAELRESEQQVTEAYGKVRSGSHVEAWQMMQAWLTKRGSVPDDYRWLCGRVSTWGDSRYLTRLTEDHVERLLALKRNGEALDVVAQRLALDPSFRPKTAASTWQIAQLAAIGGGTARVARALVADFSSRFPGDPRIAPAAILSRQLET